MKEYYDIKDLTNFSNSISKLGKHAVLLLGFAIFCGSVLKSDEVANNSTESLLNPTLAETNAS